MTLIKRLILYCALFVVSVCAQDMPPAEASADGLAGSGKLFRQGWRKDSAGNWIGTGDNFGSGWRKDSSGNWVGTGNNFGKTYRPE
jgi:hypothetical protein